MFSNSLKFRAFETMLLNKELPPQLVPCLMYALIDPNNDRYRLIEDSVDYEKFSDWQSKNLYHLKNGIVTHQSPSFGIITITKIWILKMVSMWIYLVMVNMIVRLFLRSLKF